ncbi:MAG TPA: histidinol dehydrogenase [Dehalococcoidia bacterium]|nr:histidinol dehydrogenase [Dehalococcoidia bacterium]
MRLVVGAEEARRTILRRRPASEAELSPAARKRTAEVMGAEVSAAEAVRRIVREVRLEGDAAVRRYCEAFDGVPHRALEVPREEVERALAEIPADLREALEFAAERVRRYHEGQARRLMTSYEEDGLGVRVRPLETVGFYVPGTFPVYPSSVLHTLVPAKVAGVGALVMVSPADRSGRVPAVKLAAAAIAGVDRVFMASGAQAIAALAYGTETIPRVDKIVGPGNIFVTLAKREVFGDVGIDSIYGPTETVVVADGDADPVLCAVDMIAQAEHDEMATPLLITDSKPLAEQVLYEIEKRVADLPRGNVARTAIENQGGAVVAASMEEAVALASEFAPEHLCILARDARRLAGLVKNAGGIFIGESSPEAIGDYTGGPSHVMPTGGAARFASPLSVLDFLKFSTVMEIRDEDVVRLGPPGARIAYAEGLEGHARAIEERLPK